MARAAGLDLQVYGNEPDITENSTDSEIIRAWSWYNYFHDHEDAKKYALAYLKSQKKNDLAKVVAKADFRGCLSLGWNCRILSRGGTLPRKLKLSTLERLVALGKVQKEEVTDEEPKVVISIQERVAAKANDLIGSLEEQIDIYLTKGKNDFDAVKWLRDNDVKPALAKRIAEYYNPLYAEIFDAVKGADDQLKEAYKHWKKSKLKKYMEFIKGILSAAEAAATVVPATRKPRKKKEKPAAVQVAKLKYAKEDKELKLTSIKPTDIVGARQLWVYNSKYRSLTVLDAIGPAGLAVKGSTVTGFDEKTSITKKLRKPAEATKIVLEGGKVALRNLMNTLKTKPVAAKGRLNSDVVLLRAIR